MRDVSAHISTTLACLLIAAAVLVSGTHAKDFASISLPPAVIADTKHSDDPSQHIVKIAPEYHQHTDATAKVQIAADQQADHRSLRLHEHKKEIHSRLTNRLRGLWLAGNHHV